MKFFGTTDASKRSFAHPNVVNNAIRFGTLPATKDSSGRWQIREDDLENWSRFRSRRIRRTSKLAWQQQLAAQNAVTTLRVKSSASQAA
jgi:hypothetical protein